MPEVPQCELTYAVDPGWPVPDLARAAPEGGTIDLAEHAFEATYFDTDAHTLTRLGVTLRRSGGGDAGWQLTIPGDGRATELRSRARQRTPPKTFLTRVCGVLGDEPVAMVATINTTRQVHRILDAGGTLVAEVADDDVHGVATGDEARIGAWRELEVTLGPAGDDETLVALRRLLRKAGARKGGTRSGVPRVLGDEEPGREDGAVASYLRLQSEQILLGEIRLRDGPSVDAIHDTRVAIRRLRSILRTAAPLIAGVPEELDDDLRWLAGLFHPVRDGDVLAKHLDRKLDALPPEHVLGPVRQELAQTLAADRKDALGRWEEATRDERYRRTLGAVAACHREPPVAEIAGKALRKDLEQILQTAKRKARRRLAEADQEPTRLHRARKAVKRLRYTAEAIGAEVPKAAKAGKHAKKLQGVLGDHQDLVVEAAFLRQQAAMYGAREGHNGFSYGILLAEAEQAAAKIRADRLRW